MAEWSDEELIGYAQIHSRSELALFAVAHVNRLLVLAGERPIPGGGFLSVHEPTMDAIVAKIRARQQMTPEQLHEEELARAVEVKS